MRAADGARKRAPATLVAQRVQAQGDVFERFVPGHALETSASACAGAFQGIIQPIRRIEVFDVHAPPAAAGGNGAVIRIARRVGGKIDDAPIFERHVESAEVAAIVAVSLAHLSCHAASSPRFSRRLDCMSPAHPG